MKIERRTFLFKLSEFDRQMKFARSENVAYARFPATCTVPGKISAYR